MTAQVSEPFKNNKLIDDSFLVNIDRLPSSVELDLLDTVSSSEDPVRGDEAASTDVHPAPTAV